MKALMVVMLFSIFTSPAFAQEDLDFSGKKSLTFSFNGFNLARHDFGIGGKYGLNENLLLNGSVGYNYDSTEFPVGGVGPVSSSLPIFHDTFNTIGISAGFEWHFKFFEKISPYLGGRVRVARSLDNGKEDFGNNFSNATVVTETLYGIDSIIGVEYFFWESVSLAGQYTIGYSEIRVKTDQKANDSSFATSYTTNRSFGSATSSLILSVYF